MENKKCKGGSCGISYRNKGVTCDVHNCAYHDGENYCTAEKIAVGPSFATSCTDTVCATFKMKGQNLS